MGRLHYAMITSLDGYVTDAEGGFDWAVPDPDVHQHVNDIERGIGTYLYGRRMYEVMSYWADPPGYDAQPAAAQDPSEPEHEYVGIWQSADKIVFSTSLPDVQTPRTTLEREFDAARVQALVRASERDVSIAGPTLAAHALRAGIVDEIHLYVCPVVVGSGGTPWAPSDGRLDLDLRDVHRFDGGFVYLRYDVRT